MNWDQIEGRWRQITGEVRRKWGSLTDDDVEMVKGDRDKLLGRIQERYGVTEEEASKQIDDWSKSV